MKFIIDKELLAHKLDTVNGPVAVSNTTPILNTILLDVKKDMMDFITTDKKLSIMSFTQDIEVKEQGRICVPARNFISAIKEMPKGKLELSSEKNKLLIEQKKMKLRIKVFDADEFPKMPTPPSKIKLTIPTKNLSKALQMTSFCMGVSIGFDLDGMLFELDNKQASLIATDGKRLGWINNTTKPKDYIVVPNKAIKELLKIMTDKDESVILGLDEKRVEFMLPNTSIISSLLDEKYPDYKSFLPTTKPKKLMINREELIDAIKRANLLVQAKKEDDPIVLNITEKELTITKDNPQFGEFEETLAIGFNDNPMQLGMNPKYLLEVLEILESEAVTIEIYGEDKPIVIRDSNYVYLALPIRL